MTVLLNRRATLIVTPEGSTDALAVQGLRMQFTASKTLEKSPNTAEIHVFNLAEKSRKGMQTIGANVVLQAGYEDEKSQAVVFSGNARYISHRLDGPDWVTKIECGDGEQAVGGDLVEETFAEGTPVVRALEFISGKLKVDKGNMGTQAKGLGRMLRSGFVAKGRAATVLERLLVAEGYSFSIQNGRLQILKPGQSNTDTVFVLSPSTGLIGSPEWSTPDKSGKPPTLKVVTLLLPQILPGRRVQLDSRAAKGLFMVKGLSHRGDTHEGEWHTEMECVPASEDAPKQGATT
jgi:hypothetical protein